MLIDFTGTPKASVHDWTLRPPNLYFWYTFRAPPPPEMDRFLDRFNKGMEWDLKKSPQLLHPPTGIVDADEMFLNIIYEMHAAGIQIIAGDHPLNRIGSIRFPTKVERESWIVERILGPIRSGGKVIALFGEYHVSFDGGLSAARFLSDQGYSVVSVIYHDPNDKIVFPPSIANWVPPITSKKYETPTIAIDLPFHNPYKK